MSFEEGPHQVVSEHFFSFFFHNTITLQRSKRRGKRIVSPEISVEPMATNKERLEELETSHGMMHDELQKMNGAMVDLKGDLDNKHRQMEDSFKRLMEAVTNRDSGSSAASRGERRADGSQYHTQGYRGEPENPFASGAANHDAAAPRAARLDFPRFHSGDPTEWLSKVKQYFEYHEMPHTQLVRFTAFHLDGIANGWWQTTLKALRNDGIRQTGSLEAYQEEFERLHNKVYGWSQEALVGAFMNRLQYSIANGIRMFQPKSLPEVINYTRLMEGQLQRLKKGAMSSPVMRNSTFLRPIPRKVSSEQTPKKLSWEELKKKRSLGLCFSCDERYTPGHKCKQPQFFIMEGENEGDDEDDEKIGEEEKPEISMYALEGVDTTSTIRIRASIRKQRLIALIYSGSTHNFIGEKAVRGMNLTAKPTKPFSVKVANGSPLVCRSRYEAIPVKTGGVVFPITLYALPIQPTTLQAVKSHTIDKEARMGQTIFAISAAQAHPEPVVINEELKEIVEEFDDMFKTPTQLPPERTIEHRIPLKEGTDPDRFSIPTVDDMLDELHGAVFFTKLDLTTGYHQVRMHPSDIPKTAFRTHNGHYEYLVMPFGLCNAPSTFQALMNEIFRPLLRKSVLVFFDDILIYSSLWSEHLQHVCEVFTLLRQHKLAVKYKKCEFGQGELEYLGHIIFSDGVKVDRTKIAAMLDWPQPTTVTELRGTLGLTGYYRKFVRDYGLIARSLTNLLRKGQFGWNAEAEEAFTKLKQALTTTPTLALPDFSLPFVIQTDASGEGFGAVLSQNEKPIAFMSRTFGISKKSWSTYAREMLAIVIAIRTWRPYIIGRRFIIQTSKNTSSLYCW
ncbi:Reverse transcriptase domain [Arabidopsis suecica]|uniref:Reverse transcriptase domain n=1 Tax=Arabidopsis suecica TaxID=45249 RepID=A0A8T2BRZ1_ARASU|nr:Reverse transcriptase domain [Arabidopsis suecica]